MRRAALPQFVPTPHPPGNRWFTQTDATSTDEVPGRSTVLSSSVSVAIQKTLLEVRAEKPNTPERRRFYRRADAMRSLRRERGYTQEKFAAHVGIDRSYYGAIERAGGLDVKVSELLRRARL
jgi:DNA-binding XRE family transcriptional regulator